MKYIKTLGLLAAAVAALMAFAAPASATEITSSTGSTPTIHAVAGTLTLHGVTTVECHESTFSLTIASHGSGVTASGSLSSLTFGTCTNAHVTVLKTGTGTSGTGTMEFHGSATTGNGTVTWNGTRLTIQITGLEISCIFETQNTNAGSYNSGVAAVEIASASIPRVAGDSGIFCGGNWTLTATYLIAHPTDLTIH